MDGSGKGWLVWDDNSGIDANRFVPGSGWQGVEEVVGGGGQDPRAIAQLGVATAVWYLASKLMSSRYDPAGGWSAPAAFANSENDFDLSANRNAVNTQAAVVFARNDSLFIGRYIPGSGWTGEIFGDTAPDIANLKCAMDPSGVVIAAYERDGRLATILYDPAIGWGNDLERGAIDLSADNEIDVAAGAIGNAIVGWIENSQALITTLSPTAGWSAAAIVSTRAVSSEWDQRCRELGGGNGADRLVAGRPVDWNASDNAFHRTVGPSSS